MIFQLCTYTLSNTQQGRPRYGIAKLDDSFDVPDVRWIVDCSTGEKIEGTKLHSYSLESGPMKYMDTSYNKG